VGTTAVWSANSAQWTSSSFTAYGAAIYDATVSNNLIALIDFGGALSVASGTFAIIWSASGIIILS
jgi:predicted metalloenzyme YecM